MASIRLRRRSWAVPAIREAMDPPVERLFLYHMLEEAERGAVSHDQYPLLHEQQLLSPPEDGPQSPAYLLHADGCREDAVRTTGRQDHLAQSPRVPVLSLDLPRPVSSHGRQPRGLSRALVQVDVQSRRPERPQEVACRALRRTASLGPRAQGGENIATLYGVGLLAMGWAYLIAPDALFGATGGTLIVRCCTYRRSCHLRRRAPCAGLVVHRASRKPASCRRRSSCCRWSSAASPSFACLACSSTAEPGVAQCSFQHRNCSACASRCFAPPRFTGASRLARGLKSRIRKPLAAGSAQRVRKTTSNDQPRRCGAPHPADPRRAGALAGVLQFRTFRRARSGRHAARQHRRRRDSFHGGASTMRLPS